jgi:phytoene/squalene synthetase
MKSTNLAPDPNLAASITKAASQQTYYTIRLLVDRDRLADAYRAYAYFRWVDDSLDAPTSSPSENLAFIGRQKSLLESCYRQDFPPAENANEEMLVDLVRRDIATPPARPFGFPKPERSHNAQNSEVPDQGSGLKVYLRNMMAVMDFDAHRRGRLVSQKELDTYTHHLASAVTEAMHYFIGHCCPSPHDETRYLAVTAAHITHMLRDTYGDVQQGYYNIPRELLEATHIQPDDLQSPVYRLWVRSRVQLARGYFDLGKRYLARVSNLRCRLAGYAYTARFAWLLDIIEHEDYCLRPDYSERKSFRAGLGMSWLVFSSLFNRPQPGVFPRAGLSPRPVASQPAGLFRSTSSRKP